MRHRKKKTAEHLNAHFNKRCEQRLGEILPRKQIIRRIQTGDFAEDLQFWEKQSNRVSIYKYIHKGVELLLPYDKQRHKLITVLWKDENRFTAMIKSNKKLNIQQDIQFLVNAIYNYNSVGGPMHIVLDDCNIDTHSIKWCMENSIPEEQNIVVRICSEKLCELLLSLSLEERIEYLKIDADDQLISYLEQKEQD